MRRTTHTVTVPDESFKLTCIYFRRYYTPGIRIVFVVSINHHICTGVCVCVYMYLLFLADLSQRFILGELIGYCDPSSSARPIVCPSTFINDIFSETTGPI